VKKKDIRKLDKLFSLYIRKRGSCQRCGKTHFLQTSHIYSRRYLRVRWWPDNATCLCAGCHIFMTASPVDHADFALNLLGRKRFTNLQHTRQEIRKDLTVEEVKGWWV